MKKIKLIILIIICYTSAYSQTTNILQNNLNQGEKLIEAYFTPMAETFGAGLNNAWYNTAKPHSILGFDVTFSLNTIIIPNSAENFMIGDNFNGVFTSSEEDASTIFGSMSSTNMNIILITTLNHLACLEGSKHQYFLYLWCKQELAF